MSGKCESTRTRYGMLTMWFIRAMTRDPEKYKDPEVFNPDRFFDENGELNSDDVGYAFGFGRR